MSSQDLRQKFLKFFESNGHKIVPSSSLIPENDPSVLLTTAGMQQFKPYFAGEKDVKETFGNTNLTSIQKCFRTTDIDNVGDISHLTFFEMLGNFSIGGYFKEEAIKLMWKFAVNELGLQAEKLSATYFEGDGKTPRDDEARNAWLKFLPEERVKSASREDTFWGPTGNEGPCGTSSEFFYETENGQKLEIWTLVFMAYNCEKGGKYTLLSAKGVDTGGGLERLICVTANKPSVFETDLFMPIIQKIEELTGQKYGDSEETDRKIRIIADHTRAVTFLMADGVEPSNKERGYVLRRLIRRVVTHGRILKENIDSLKSVAEVVVENYQDQYPELKKIDLEVLTSEEEKFKKTLKEGLKKYQNYSENISGAEAFLLFQSFGFPIELTMELASEDGKKVDKESFDKEFQKHQEASRN